MPSYSWGILQKHVDEILQSDIGDHISLVKYDEKNNAVFLRIGFNSDVKQRLGVASRGTYTIRVKITNKFPIEPPSVVFVDNKTLATGRACWPGGSHLFPPGSSGDFPDGWICMGYTAEFYKRDGRTSWGNTTDGEQKSRVTSLLAVVKSIEDLIRGFV
nr:hypothetical protein [Candidatus Sigynarchaeota archaeon]